MGEGKEYVNNHLGDEFITKRDKPVCKMSEEELREELIGIRGNRAGKGRRARKEAKVKRISQAGQDRRVKKNVEAEEQADWV